MNENYDLEKKKRKCLCKLLFDGISDNPIENRSIDQGEREKNVRANGCQNSRRDRTKVHLASIVWDYDCVRSWMFGLLNAVIGSREKWKPDSKWEHHEPMRIKRIDDEKTCRRKKRIRRSKHGIGCKRIFRQIQATSGALDCDGQCWSSQLKVQL